MLKFSYKLITHISHGYRLNRRSRRNNIIKSQERISEWVPRAPLLLDTIHIPTTALCKELKNNWTPICRNPVHMAKGGSTTHSHGAEDEGGTLCSVHSDRWDCVWLGVKLLSTRAEVGAYGTIDCDDDLGQVKCISTIIIVQSTNSNWEKAHLYCVIVLGIVELEHMDRAGWKMLWIWELQFPSPPALQ